MAKKYLVDVDLSKNSLLNPVIHPLASAPSSPVEGQVYYNTTDDTIYVRANGAWLDLGVQGGAGATDLGVTLSATNTVVTSNTGADATIPAADATNAGVMTKAMYDKLTAIEANADVTDAANVEAAGALMDSEVDADIKTLSLPASTTISTFGASLIDDAAATNARTTLGLVTGTDVQAYDTNILTASNTKTLTNKTFDANGTGNSLSNVEVADLAASAVVTAAEGIGSNNNDTTIPTSAAVKAYADAVVGAADAMRFLGAIDASTNPNYPSAVTGDTYKISVAGKIGGASGTVVEVGDTIIATADNAGGTQASVGTSWAVLQTNVEAATTTLSGIVELATATEAEARTDTVRAVTPVSLANFPVKKIFTIGDGAATSIALTHSLGNKDVITQVRQASDDAVVECDIVNTSTTVTTLSFATAPATNAIKAVVMG